MNILYHKSLSLKVSKMFACYREPILVYSCDSWIVRKFRCEGGCASQTRRWRSYNWEQHSEMIKSKHDLYEMWNHVVLQDGWGEAMLLIARKGSGLWTERTGDADHAFNKIKIIYVKSKHGSSPMEISVFEHQNGDMTFLSETKNIN